MTFNYAVYCGPVLMKRTLTYKWALKFAKPYGDRGRIVEQTYVTTLGAN
jgi:hypothetical protein